MLDSDEILCEIEEYNTQNIELQKKIENGENTVNNNLAARYSAEIVQILVQLREKAVLYNNEIKTIYGQ